MKRAFLLLTMLCLAAAAARADDQTLAVQQALKDQGFYYSTVDGQPGPETDAAVRRYQIRQGLEVTGKLDAETLAALKLGGSAEAAPQPAAPDTTDAQPAQEQQGTPAPQEAQSDPNILRNVPPAQTPDDSEGAPPRAEPAQPPEQVQPAQPPGPSGVPMQPFMQPAPLPEYSDFFRKTPYATAPAVVQQSTVRKAQMRLGRQGFYRGAPDGSLSKSFSRAIAAYQNDAGMKMTGRLDLKTLAALNLLPPMAPGPPPEDAGPGVYRGIWVH